MINFYKRIMLNFLPSLLIGLLSFSFYALNTLFWLIPIVVFSILKALLPFRSWQKLFSYLLDHMASNWVAVNTLNQKLMSMMFDKLEVKVDIVSNGQEAVNAVLANSYDVVFMDIQMPVMNGIEACKTIKESSAEKNPVIVALTANSLDGDREKFIESGMDDYLPKPLSLDDIRKTLKEYSS